MNLWDREELSLAGDESEKPPEDDELGFSPGGPPVIQLTRHTCRSAK